jgi:hypothetical protein
MLLRNALIGDRFVKYTAVLAISIYKNFKNSGAINIIVRIHIIIVLIDRSATPF